MLSVTTIGENVIAADIRSKIVTAATLPVAKTRGSHRNITYTSSCDGDQSF